MKTEVNASREPTPDVTVSARTEQPEPVRADDAPSAGAAFAPTRVGVESDPVEEALTAALRSLAEVMTRASASEVVSVAERMATLTRELEARRLARAGVPSLEEERRRRVRG